jgi:hypothetical protein
MAGNWKKRQRRRSGGCGTNVTSTPGSISYTPKRTGLGRFAVQGSRKGPIRYTPNRLKVGQFCDPNKRR